MTVKVPSEPGEPGVEWTIADYVTVLCWVVGKLGRLQLQAALWRHPSTCTCSWYQRSSRWLLYGDWLVAYV